MATPSILKVLTELTALTPTGVTILKPFRPWFGLPIWRNRTVGIRLLNAQEIQEAMNFINDTAGLAQDQALKKELVARSLWSVDGSFVVTDEELKVYNEEHRSELTQLEYKRIFVNAFEQYLIDYLYGLYVELQGKQNRKIFGLQQCAVCKKVYATLPADVKQIRFSTAEIVCGECMSSVKEEDGFDFIGGAEFKKPETGEVPEPSITLDTEAPPVTTVLKTPADFETMDDYRNYMIEQAETKERESRELHT